jgi:hypothetical protein
VMREAMAGRTICGKSGAVVCGATLDPVFTRAFGFAAAMGVRSSPGQVGPYA